MWCVHASADGATAGRDATVMIRPEALQVLPAEGERNAADLEGSVVDRRFAGAMSFYHVLTGDRELLVQGGVADAAVGDSVRIRPRPGAMILAFPVEGA